MDTSRSTPTVIPPLRLIQNTSNSASPTDTDALDRERQKMTALTIVELLARGSSSPSLSSDPVKKVESPPISKTTLPPPLPENLLPRLPTAPWNRPLGSLLPRPEPVAVLPAPAPTVGQSVSISNETPPTSTTKPAVMVNSSRKRQKDELTRLRAQVQELQRELEHVRARLPQKPSLLASGTGYNAGTDQCSQMPTSLVWERIAMHQKEEKSKAEIENLRLKGMVHDQLKISKGLEKLLNKRRKTSSAELSAPEKRLRVDESNNSSIYSMLAASVDGRLHQLDAVFEKNGMAREKREMQETQVVMDDTHGPMIEVKEAKIFPFDVHSTSDALWRCLGVNTSDTLNGNSSVNSFLLHGSHNLNYLKISLPFRQHRAPDGELVAEIVIKRIDDRNRVLLLWESLGESFCPTMQQNGTRGVEIREYGWGIIEPLPCPAGEASSLLQLCSYIKTLPGDGQDQGQQQFHGLTEVVGPTYLKIWGTRQQLMENLLMESTITEKRGGQAKTIVL